MLKARMKFVKEGRAKYLSHLDLMHTLQRAMARCEMPLWFTEGFHQHSYVSIALPLSTGYSSECEFLDFILTCDAMPINAVEAFNAVCPEGLRAIEIYPLGSADYKVGKIAWSRYRITWGFEGALPQDFCPSVRAFFNRPVIEILKKSKRGEKLVNLRDLMRDFELTENQDTAIATVTTAAGNTSLSPAYLTQAIERDLPQFSIPFCAYHRLAVFTDDGNPFH